jgi:exonuclease III
VKIITWNCNGALRKKYHKLEEINADIFIIQECENPNESNDNNYLNWAGNYLWIGDTKNKGIGVFAKKNLLLKKLDWSNTYKDHIVKYFLPFSINNEIEFLAIWAHQNNSPNFGYVGQLWKYLQINRDKIGNTILIGDFNSNKIWDEWDRWWNHSDVVKELSQLGIESLYHKYTKEGQGEETQPTFYLQRKIDKPYHIDYCFAPKKFADNLIKFDIGKYENWKEFSDHNPIIIEFKT